MITGELTDGFGLDYRSGSYRSFGNNGSVPMDTGMVGVDYDANNDGMLDSTPWSALLDAVAIGSSTEPAYIFGTKILNANNSGVVDGIVRFQGNINETNSLSYYGGEILDTGTNAIDLQFQAAPFRSANFQINGWLTPGLPKRPCRNNHESQSVLQ